MSKWDETYFSEEICQPSAPGKNAEVRTSSAIDDDNQLIGQLTIYIHNHGMGTSSTSLNLTDPSMARSIAGMLIRHANRMEALHEEANFLRVQAMESEEIQEAA